jgi:hypothetical protein
MTQRHTIAAAIALTLGLVACGGGADPLTDAEQAFCYEISPPDIIAAGDAMGIDVTGAFDAAERAFGQALDEGVDSSEALDRAQAAIEDDSDYIAVCRDLYANR